MKPKDYTTNNDGNVSWTLSADKKQPIEGLDEAAEKFVGYDMDCDKLYEYEIGVAAFKAGAEWAIHYQEKKIADAYEKGKQEGIRVVRSWESSPGQGGY